MVNETLMRDKSWDYNNRVYELWRIWDHWPSTSLLQMAGPTPDGAMIQAVWRDEEGERRYMAEEGIERFTQAARQLAAERDDQPADVLPTNRELKGVSFGPLAARFIDIGADLDGAVGRQFGTTLTAVDLDFSCLDDRQLAELLERVGIGAEQPEDLILRIVHVRDGGIWETQAWPSEQRAREFAESAAAVASELTGRSGAAPFALREIKRLAISSAGLDPALF